MEAVFAGMVNGRLSLLVRSLVSDENGKITAEKRESSDIKDSPLGYFIGLNRHIREYVKPSSDWERLGHRQAARRFVEMKSARTRSWLDPRFPSWRSTTAATFIGYCEVYARAERPTEGVAK
jgi:hypothetical protein